jgi:hypothetical protein
MIKLVKESIDTHLPSYDELYDTAPQEIKDYIDKSASVPQSPKWHPEGNNLVHMKIVYDRAAATGDINMAMAAFFHDLGKVDTTAKNNRGDWSAYGHEEISAKLAVKHHKWIERWGADPVQVYHVVKNHMKVKFMDEMRPSKKEEFKRQPYFAQAKAFSSYDDMKTLTDEEMNRYR